MTWTIQLSAVNAFLKGIKSYLSETFIRSFQFKSLADITFTNHRRAKIRYVPNDLCTYCEEGSETVHRLFYECSLSYRFWKQYVEFTLKDVFVGRQAGEYLTSY